MTNSTTSAQQQTQPNAEAQQTKAPSKTPNHATSQAKRRAVPSSNKAANQTAATKIATTKKPASKKQTAPQQTTKTQAAKKHAPKKAKRVKNMTRASIYTFFERLRAQRPEPKTELNYSSAFELLIAVMLSAQATDVSVNKATDKLFPIANSPAQVLALGVDGLKHYIKTIGLFNAKAENVIKTCELLLSLHGGEVPAQREALEALPGVGRKTANVVLNTAFGQPAMAVDTHIFRVGNRTGLAIGANVLQVEHRLMKVIPTEFMLDAHHWLILHGRYCCTARSPKCAACVVSDVCNWPERFDYGAPSIDRILTVEG